jgi:hypothetical protein
MKPTPILLLLAASVGLLTACNPDDVAGHAGSSSSSSSSTASSASSSSSPGSASHTASILPAPPAENGAASSDDTDPGDVQCTADDLDSTILDIDSGESDTDETPIMVTNVSDGPCDMTGFSDIDFGTGPDGHPLGIEVERAGEGAPEAIIEPGDQAWMDVTFPTSGPDDPACSEQANLALVTMPGDTDPTDVAFDDESKFTDPVCGTVTVSAWQLGGGPG